MASFTVGNVSGFDIDATDFNFYVREFYESDLDEDIDVTVNGILYPDVYWMSACLQLGEITVPAGEVAAFLREWHNHAAAARLAPPESGGLRVRREVPTPVARVKRHARGER